MKKWSHETLSNWGIDYSDPELHKVLEPIEYLNLDDIILPSEQEFFSWMKSSRDLGVRNYYSEVEKKFNNYYEFEEKMYQQLQKASSHKYEEIQNVFGDFLISSNLTTKKVLNPIRFLAYSYDPGLTLDGAMVRIFYDSKKEEIANAKEQRRVEQEKQLKEKEELLKKQKFAKEEKEKFAAMGMRTDRQYVLSAIGATSVNNSILNAIMEGQGRVSTLDSRYRPFHTAAAYFNGDRWMVVQSALTPLNNDLSHEIPLSDWISSFDYADDLIAQETDEIDVNKLKKKVGIKYGTEDFMRLIRMGISEISDDTLKKFADEFKGLKDFPSSAILNFSKSLLVLDRYLGDINHPSSNSSVPKDYEGEYCTEIVYESLKEGSRMLNSTGRYAYFSIPSDPVEYGINHKSKFIHLSGDGKAFKYITDEQKVRFGNDLPFSEIA